MSLFGKQNILKMKLLQRHKTHILLFFILALAAFVRLYKIADYLTFLGDEGRDVLVVYNILHGHFTLLGPTSSVGGFFLGPIYYYFMAPFLWLFNYSPVGPAVMIALCGVVAVWLVYYVGSRFFNTSAGLIAALLFAINPLVILYARSSWNPNLMPLVTLLMLFTLYKAVEKKSWKLYALTGVLYGIAMQLHYIEVFVGPIMALYVLIGNVYQPFDKKKFVFPFADVIKATLVTFAGFIVGWSPFLAFEARHGFNNLRAIFNFVFHPQVTGNGVGVDTNFITTVAGIFPRIFGRLIINIPSPDLYHNYLSWEIQTWLVASWVVAVICIVFIFWRLSSVSMRTKFLQYLLLTVWISMGILFFGLYKKNIYDYYFEFLFPVPAILVGGLLAWFWNKNMLLRISTGLLLIILLAINLQGIPFRYPGNRQLQQTETIARFVLDKTGGKPFNFALITGGNSDHAYRYFFTIWGHPPVTIQFVGVDPKRTSVTSQLLVVCEQACQPLGNSLWEVAGFGRADIVGQWPVSVVQVYKLVHYRGN